MIPTNIVRADSLGKQIISPKEKLTILHNVNLSVKNGESLAIIGVSGSGKSTLLGLLAGLDEPTTGKVFLGGNDLSVLDEDDRARIRCQLVGFVFQSFHLLSSLTALENTSLPLELAGVSNSEQIAKQKLHEVGLEKCIHHYPGQLSGGEQQRVAIARAFANNPKILFADEPTGNLDQKTTHLIINLLFKMNKENGTTLIIVTHNNEIAKACDRYIIIAGGELVEG